MRAVTGAIAIRRFDRQRDRRAVEAIDTGFETDRVLDVVARPRGIELIERALERPMTKQYPIDEVYASWSTWDHAWVADDGAVQGFAAVEHEPWHQRLVLWHLYVQPAARRRGVARRLLAEVEAHGRGLGATHVWLETSSVNLPGVRAYERLGYALCGADTLLYGRYMPGEAAIYLAKVLGSPP